MDYLGMDARHRSTDELFIVHQIRPPRSQSLEIARWHPWYCNALPVDALKPSNYDVPDLMHQHMCRWNLERQRRYHLGLF